MKRRKQPRRKSDDEKIINSRSTGQLKDLMEMNLALKRPLMPETIVQLQQTHGNQYVQQVMRNRQQEEERDSMSPETREGKASERLSQRTEYPMVTKGQLTKEGGLDLDLKHAIHMDRYSPASQAFKRAVPGWFGLGQVKLNQERFMDEKIKMASDGRCHLKLGDKFLDLLSQSQDPNSKESRAMLDFNQEFDVKLKASLHYRSQDQRLQNHDVEGGDKVADGNKSRPGFFLKIDLESVYINRIDGKPQEQALSGTLLLQGMVNPT